MNFAHERNRNPLDVAKLSRTDEAQAGVPARPRQRRRNWRERHVVSLSLTYVSGWVVQLLAVAIDNDKAAIEAVRASYDETTPDERVL